MEKEFEAMGVARFVWDPLDYYAELSCVITL